MKVTDKNIPMVRELYEKLQLYAKRVEYNYDHLIVVFGEVGIGKSNLGVEVGYTMAHILGKKFTNDNIYFDANQLMNDAANTEKEVFMWDEAALDGMSSNWQNAVQKKLIQCLMTARKKRHFYLFLIPNINKLQKYFIERSVGLIHVFTIDDIGIKRGGLRFFNDKKKKKVLKYLKKGWDVPLSSYSFKGQFKGMLKYLIDSEKYEKAKSDHIRKVFSIDDTKSAYHGKFEDLRSKVAVLTEELKKNHDITTKTVAKYMDIPYNRLLKYRDYEFHPKLNPKKERVV